MTAVAMRAPVQANPTPGERLSQRKVRLFALLLGVMAAVGPATIDMYLPSLPQITTDMGSTDALVQLTLTGTMLGMGIGQLVIGPLSDTFGRRRPLLIGLLAHVAASLAIVVAPTVAVLGVLRVVQGFGAAASATIAMAVVRDLFVGVRAAQLFSRLMLVVGIAPVVAPSLGSAILRVGSWRAIFVVLALVSTMVVLISWRFLPETLPPSARRPVGLASMAGVVAGLVRDRVFVGLVLASGCSFGAVIAYVSGSPFVLQDGFGLSVQQFGVAFSAGAVGMVVMTQVNVPLLRRFEPGRLLLTGIIGCLVSTAVLLATALTGAGGLFGVLVPIWSAMAFLALTFPNTPAIALSRHGEAAGTASAVMGASQNLVAAAAAPIVGLLGSSAVSLGLVMFGCFAVALTLLLFVVRPQGLKLPADLMRNDRTPVAAH